MRALFLLLVLPTVALAQAPTDPVPVTFLPGGADVEGCYAQWATNAAVRAFSAPTSVSRHTRTIDAQRRVDANDYSEALMAVLRSGLARARRPLQIDAYRLGTERTETVRLALNDELEILAFAPEESVYFAFGNGVYTGVVPGVTGGDGVEMVREPITELWVRLIEHGEERPAAWLNTAQAGMIAREPFCPQR